MAAQYRGDMRGSSRNRGIDVEFENHSWENENNSPESEEDWASPGKIDTKLSDFSLNFKIFRGKPSEGDPLENKNDSLEDRHDSPENQNDL